MKSHRYVKVFPQQVVGLLGPCVSLQEATTQREALNHGIDACVDMYVFVIQGVFCKLRTVVCAAILWSRLSAWSLQGAAGTEINLLLWIVEERVNRPVGQQLFFANKYGRNRP